MFYDVFSSLLYHVCTITSHFSFKLDFPCVTGQTHLFFFWYWRHTHSQTKCKFVFVVKGFVKETQTTVESMPILLFVTKTCLYVGIYAIISCHNLSMSSKLFVCLGTVWSLSDKYSMFKYANNVYPIKKDGK